MSQQPPQDYGTAGEQYSGQFGQQAQGTQAFGQQSGQFGQPSQHHGGGAEQFGQQGGMQRGGQAMDVKLEEGISEEMRVVLHDLVQSATACEWCAERCVDEGPEMAECLRLCRDVADLATLNVQFMARDSIFGPEAIEVFASAAEACAQECARHGHRHCQECAEVLSRAVQSTRKMLASFGREGGQMQGGQIGSGMQPGGSFRGQEFGQPQGGSFGGPGGQGYSEAPGQQAQLPIEGGGGFQGQQGQEYGQSGGEQFGQPGGEQYGQSQGQQYGQGQQFGGGQQY